jgi:flagellar basal body-associated protein FliL
MSDAPKPGPVPDAEAHDDQASAEASGGQNSKWLALVAGGCGLGAFITGLVIVALLAPAKPAPPPPPPAPPVMETAEVELPEIVVKAQHSGRMVTLAIHLSLEMQTKGSALILQSRLPAFREAFAVSAARLVASSGSTVSADALKAAATDTANEILTRTKCADLAPATQAQGCTPGSEFPVGAAFVRNIVAY